MKDYRDKERKNLMYLLFFLFLIWCTPVLSDLPTLADQNKSTALSSILESAIISAVLSCAAVICDCIVSSGLKDKLVGLFFIPRAGETVFSRIASNGLSDSRFRTSDAASLYTSIIESCPSAAVERREFENTNWYRIYLKYQEKGQVRQSQRDYLMCRDLYTQTLSFGVVYILSIHVFPAVVVCSPKFIMLLCALAIAFNICTHLKMNRFVNTVIAVDVSEHLRKRETAETQ